MSTPYVIYENQSGKVIGNGYTSNVASLTDKNTATQSVLFIEENIDWDECYVDLETLTLVKINKRPSHYHTLNMSTKQWEVDSVLSARHIRLERDRLLQETDWTQNSDVPEATKSLYTTYRQQLRDITDQESFPESVIWPVTP